MDMNAWKLGWRRLEDQWRYQYRALRSAVDWTVMLYIILPGLFFGIRGYYSLWAEGLPGWILRIPFTVLVVACYLCVRMGSIRVLVEEGDALFLRQKKEWVYKLTLMGCTYSIILQVLRQTVLWVILLPILIRVFGWGYEQWVMVLFFNIMASVLWSFVQNKINISFSGWRHVLMGTLFTVIGGMGYTVLMVTYAEQERILIYVSMLLLLLNGLFCWRRIKNIHSFEGDVREEGKLRMKWTAFLLRDTLDRQPWFRTRRPLLFRSSNHLFRKRDTPQVLAESSVKSLFRMPVHIKLMVQFWVVGTVAVLLTPGMLKTFVCVGLIALLMYWMNGVWKQFIAADYLKLFQWEEKVVLSAKPMAIYGMMLPLMLWFGMVSGGLLFGWIGGIVALPLCAAAGWVAVKRLIVYL
ncbi:hypothetical protein BVG16_02485 [Paenibacillus selenitireducens]|uniref:Uncharacterized protein n=1 Tax=Paenibacillus selenitireducens TaxID=1324314 RepID=A0A1T2XN18_9BACL|nr:ABC transporter permease [Paenibacillus selenitireducens]OPA81212.1 hypothetical protein BVG16_02485 [Paenibacillus selenitireducens]